MVLVKKNNSEKFDASEPEKRFLILFNFGKKHLKLKNKNDQEKLELLGRIRKLELEDILSNVSSCDEIEGFPFPYAYFALPPTSSFNFHCL